MNLSLFWGGLFALFYSLIFFVFGGAIIRLLTDVPEVVSLATHYLPWVIILPIAAMGCFLFDGVFVGLTRAKDMRNTMLISATFGFFGLFLVGNATAKSWIMVRYDKLYVIAWRYVMATLSRNG